MKILQKQVTVLIVEDHQLVTDALSAALSENSDIRVLASARTVAEALDVVERFPADIVLMDYRLPDGDGVSAGRQMMALHPQLRVIMVTGVQSDDVFADVLTAGFAGCVSKGDDLDRLSDAIFAAAAGMAAWSPDLLIRATRARTSQLKGTDLSRRERQVVQLLSEGVPSAEMVALLNISANTLRNHVQNAMEKLDSHTRLEAVATARRLGIVEDRTVA
jgi:DNA-binding NarL/FixJ family response regulator